ncbi:MAG: hypothetical protein HAW66_01670 [Shewanella sp.]|nr:hypothetical protein [Shewanella sp.]
MNTLLLNCSVCTQRLEYADINTHLKFCSTHQQYISIQILNKAKVLMIITNLAAELSGSKVKVSELEANAMVDGTFSHEHSKTKLFFSKVSGITINTDLTGDDLDLAPLTRLYGPKIKPKLLEQVSALEKETALVNALEKETALAAHEAAGRYNQASSTQCIENKFFFPHNGQFSPDYTYQLGSRSKEEALALIIRVIASENSSYHCLSTEEAAHEFLSIKRRSTEDHWEVKSIQGISLNLAFTEHYVCFEKFLTIWRGERGKNIISKLNFKKLPC